MTICLGRALNIFLTSCGFIMPSCLEFSQSSSMHSKWIVSKSDRYCLTSYVFGYISLIKKVKAKFAQGGFFRIRFKEIRCCHCETVLKRTILCLYSFIRFPTDFYVSMVCFDYLLDVDFISFECFRIKSVFRYLSNHWSYIIFFHLLRVLSVLIRCQVYWTLPRKRGLH